MSTPPNRTKTGSPPPGRPASRPAPAPQTQPQEAVRDLGEIDQPEPGVRDLGDIDKPRQRMSLDRNHKPSTTTQNHSGYGSPVSSAVKQMQQSIVDFSNTISNVNLKSMKPDQQQDDSFGGFISQQYMGSTDPNALDALANQMKRIGAPGQHDKLDGIWGNNTNQALKSIIQVSQAMFAMSKDMNYPLQGYTLEQLEAFQKLVPESYTELRNPQDKESRAKEITNHIQQLAMLFRSLKQGVMKNPQLKSIVDQKKSFMAIPQSSQSAYSILNDDEKKVYEQYKSTAFQPSNATMSDLLSLPAFKIYMTKNQLDPSKPEEVTKALEQISAAVSV